jgi:hypothetical protein
LYADFHASFGRACERRKDDSAATINAATPSAAGRPKVQEDCADNGTREHREDEPPPSERGIS